MFCYVKCGADNACTLSIEIIVGFAKLLVCYENKSAVIPSEIKCFRMLCRYGLGGYFSN